MSFLVRDLTGIKYRIFSLGVSFLLMAVLVLIFSKFWNSKKRDKRGNFIGLIVLVFSIANICYYGNILYNPTISYHDGYFVEERRNAAITPYTHEYIFTNENDTKPIFYLDNFSKNKFTINLWLKIISIVFTMKNAKKLLLA